MTKKIAVLGTGANGSCISADLIRAGYDVTMIDQWPAHVEKMRHDGLTISMPDEELHVRVNAYHLCDDCMLHIIFDVVLLCVKAYDTRWACELIKPYLAPDGILVGVQNGMTVDDIIDIVGADRTIGCVVELASEMFEPGRVKRSIPPSRAWFGLGAVDPAMQDRVQEIADIMKHAGRVGFPEKIISAKWMKLIVNSMSMGPQAMLGLNGSEAVKLPGVREIMLRCGGEALAAGQSKGYTIEPIFGLKREDIEGSNDLLEMLLDKIMAAVGPTAHDTVVQDHMKGRNSEVDLINGAVFEENTRRGRPSKANQMIVEMSRRIHAGEIKADPSNLAAATELLARLDAGA